MLIVFLILNLILIPQETKKTFKLSNFDIVLDYKSDNAKVDIKIDKISDGLEIATITLSSNKLFSPKELNLEWAVPSTNIAGYWSSRTYLNKTITPDWGPAKVESMLARESPVITLFGHDDMNRQTFAVSEVLNTVVTSTSVKEENGMMYNAFKLFKEKHKKLKKYTVQVRMDTREIDFSKSLKDVADWWANMELFKPAPVPDAARLPVYSSWYSYHQNVTKDALLAECRLAKDMGFESIIVDDGWQTLDSNRGYAYTGDWDPERIPEMKEFVKAVHDMDMKFILWYAVPFVGEKSKAYEKMKGKFLTYWNGQGTYVVDPRFPEVREFIINTYIKAVKEWDLDGFKLDFLGRFRAVKETRLVADEGRDYASVNEATDRLMTDLMSTLRKIKPDIMIEFRQPYTGPAMRKYGNMLRATDCPNVALLNRVETTDLRLLSGNTSVHADMLMWHYTESTEHAALQLLNVMFSVPQISVRLADIPKEHFDMIRFYTDYWVKNRDVLLDGDFKPYSPQTNYPILEGKTDKKQITAVFNDMFIPVDISNGKDFDVLNGKNSKRIVIDFIGNSKHYQISVFDCRGNEVERSDLELKKGVMAFNVPASGLIQFKLKK